MYGVDYNDTFAKFISICCILALVAIEDMEIHDGCQDHILQWKSGRRYLHGTNTRKQTLVQKPHFVTRFMQLKVSFKISFCMQNAKPLDFHLIRK
jgi:hypothetical protein